MAAGLIDVAVTSAVSGINSMVYNNEKMTAREPVENTSKHFGMSALQAAVKIVGGVASAASAVLGSSRESLVQVVHKKYGQDAGYIAERTIGLGSNISDMLVYFDEIGISRRVVVSGANKASSTSNTESEKLTDSEQSEVVFENEWLEDQFKQEQKSNASITKDNRTVITI